MNLGLNGLLRIGLVFRIMWFRRGHCLRREHNGIVDSTSDYSLSSCNGEVNA